MGEGALCLSSCRCNPSALRNPGESDGEQDRHKAPAHHRIRPLSLQVSGSVHQNLFTRVTYRGHAVFMQNLSLHLACPFAVGWFI